MEIDCNNNAPIPNATNAVFIPGADGAYAVEVTNEAGCTALSECTTVTGLGMQGFSGPQVTLYPNPAKAGLWVESPLQIDKAEVYNLLGQRLPVQREGSYWDVSKLSPGHYFIRLKTDKGTWTGRFVKE